MKNTLQTIGSVCIAALALNLLSASAAEKKSAPATPLTNNSPATASDKPLPYHGTIASINQSAKTFTIAGKKASRVFKITDQTKIMKDGNPATLSDLVEKEEVRGSYWRRADGSLEAKSVKLGTRGEKKDSKKTDSTSSSPTP